MKADDSTEFSRPFRVDQLDEREVALEISADDEERKALAIRLDIPAVTALQASLRLRSEKGLGRLVRVTGAMSALVEQTCVVTLERISNSVDAEIDRLYGYESWKAHGGVEEIDIDFQMEDPPDPIVNETIDLGELVTETLALEIDPFPKKTGAVFDGYGDADYGDESSPASPFAKLAELKKRESR